MDSQKARLAKAIKLLRKEYPRNRTALKHRGVFQLAVAVILSAQCTDARVNIVTKKLFEGLRTPIDFARISQSGLEKLIYSTGFYRSKAKNIRAMAKILVEKHNSRVPKTMRELLELPGIARKTANIILYEGYGIVEGIAVDTHVKRLSKRLGFTKSNNPAIIERDLMQLAEKKHWGEINGLLVFHGRNTCTARNPGCAKCVLNTLCPSAFSFGPKKH